MIKVKVTAKEAFAEFKKWVDKPSSKAPKAPWVYNLNIAGCALGYGWFVKYPTKQWTVSSWVAIAKKNKTFRSVDLGDAKFGDAVFFDWDGGRTEFDHIGFFIKQNKYFVKNISANSTGGLVRIKWTSKRFVSGIGTVVKFAEEKPSVVAPVPPTVIVEPPVVPPVVVPPVVVTPPVVVPPTKEEIDAVLPANAKPKYKYDIVKRGDSYWAIARRTLAVTNTPKNYARITIKMKQIQKWNKNKPLHAGDKIRVK